MAVDTGLYPRFFVLALSFLPYLLSKKSGLGFSFHPSDVAILCFLLVVIFNSWRSVNSGEAWTWLIRPCYWISAFYVFKQLSKRERTVFFYSLLFSGSIIMCYSFWQLSHTTLNRASSYHVMAFSGHKNLLISTLLLLAGICLIEVYRHSLSKKLLVFTCISLMLSALLSSKTGILGSALIAFGWGIVAFCFKNDYSKQTPYPPRVPAFMTLLIVAVFFFGIPVALKIPFISQLDPERYGLWHKSFKLIVEHPFLGIGSGNWQVLLPSQTLTSLYRLSDLNVTFQRPHNDFILILCETGIIGFYFFLFTPVFSCIETIKNGWNQANAIYLLIMVVVALLLFTDFPLERPEHGLLLMFILSSSFEINPVKEKKLPAYLVIAFLFYVSVVSFFRIKGEYYTQEMNSAFSADNSIEVIKNGQLALSPFYTLDPWSNPIYWQTGRAWSRLHKPDSAFRHFRLGLDAAPYHHHLINDLGVLFFERKQINQALQLFKEALRINPRFDEPALNIARMQLLEGNLGAAKQTLDSMKHDSPERSHLLQLTLEKQQGIH